MMRATIALLVSVLCCSCGGGGGGGTANEPPVATLTASVSSGQAPLVVRFDASQSSDPDGNILSYGWDIDGDGSIDHTTAVPQASFAFTDTGAVSVTVTVTDNSGASDTASTSITVDAPEPQIEESATLGSVGDLSLAVINGLPGVAYIDGGSLRYTHADASVAEWSDPVEISPADNSEPSLASVGGRPAVAFHNGAEFLNYARAVVGDGSIWQPAVTVVQIPQPGTISEPQLLARPQGPAILSAIKLDLAAPRHVLALFPVDDLGDAWSDSAATVNEGQTEAARLIAKDIGGRGGAAWVADGLLFFAHAENDAATIWGAPVEMGDPGDIDGDMSLADLGGVPALAYSGQGGIFAVFANDTAGATWGELRNIATHEGDSLTLASIAGVPMVAYEDEEIDTLSLLVGTDEAGSSFNDMVLLGGNFRDVSMVELNGRPLIVAADPDNTQLRSVVLP